MILTHLNGGQVEIWSWFEISFYPFTSRCKVQDLLLTSNLFWPISKCIPFIGAKPEVLSHTLASLVFCLRQHLSTIDALYKNNSYAAVCRMHDIRDCQPLPNSANVKPFSHTMNLLVSQVERSRLGTLERWPRRTWLVRGSSLLGTSFFRKVK
jgi:hypothetical protein